MIVFLLGSFLGGLLFLPSFKFYFTWNYLCIDSVLFLHNYYVFFNEAIPTWSSYLQEVPVGKVLGQFLFLILQSFRGDFFFSVFVFSCLEDF